MNGRRLKELREARGWTQQELEDRSGVKQQKISAMEKGLIVNPTLETVLKLADGLDMSVAELIAAVTSTPEQVAA